MLEIQNFSKAYKSSKVFSVKNVSFKIEKGSVTALLGPNGSGKTTILKALSGLHYATEGKILITNGKKTTDITFDSEKAKHLISFVPEIPVLPENLTVENFLSLNCLLYKKNDFSNAVKECELESVLHKKIKTLSKGFRQRISLAAALIKDSEILILDEPISGLDPAQIASLRKLLTKEAETKAVLFSTHILSEAQNLCKKFLILTNGQLIEQGSESEIINRSKVKNLEEAFVKLTQEKNEN